MYKLMCKSRNHVYQKASEVLFLSPCLPPGCAALLWALPNRVSAVAREGSQEYSATSGQVWELGHIKEWVCGVFQRWHGP